MPISSTGLSVGFIPPSEFFGKEARFSERRSTVAEPSISVPGNGERQDSHGREPVRLYANVENFELAYNRRLQFEVDHQSNEVLVKVIDNETDEVVRVLPPEELQRLRGNAQEATGSLFSERA